MAAVQSEPWGDLLMGFPSPADDYVESRPCLNVMCQVRGSVTLFEIDGILHLLDSGLNPGEGDVLCYELYGERGVGKLMGGAIITREGEALEGNALEDVMVLGKVTFMVAKAHDDERPII